jgi:hypothetical protein
LYLVEAWQRIAAKLEVISLHKQRTAGAPEPTIAAVGVWIGVAVGVAVLVVASLVTVRLRSVQATADDAWQQVLLALRRRRGLAAELAEAVRMGSRGKINMVDRVHDASEVADLPGASPEQQRSAERELDEALAELSDAVAHSPALLQDAEVTALRTRLDDADHRIAARRSVYEHSVDALQRRAASMPGRWVARALGIQVGPSAGEE